MTNMQSKRIFVFASTGDQGKSVCFTLARAGYQVTGLTRNTEGRVAKELDQAGVNMVKGDLDNPESYKRYLKDQDAVYLNADGMSAYFANGLNVQAAFYDGELVQAQNAAQACIDQGVKFIVYSVLTDYEGERSVPHFDVKTQVMEYIKSKNVPAAFLNTCGYFSDMLKYDLLKKNEDGSLTMWLLMPDDTQVNQFAVEQTGEWVKAILEDPKACEGSVVDASAGDTTVAEMCKIMSEICGVTVHSPHLSKEAFDSDEIKSQVTEEVWKNYRSWVEGYFERDETASKKVFPGQWDFKTWAANSKELRKVLTA